MTAIKISSKVDEKVWADLRAHARESDRNIAGVLTEAIAEYLQRRRVRPEVMDALDASIADHERLGELLAK